MNINTKYKLNQSVWFMKDNKPQEHKIGIVEFSQMNDDDRPDREYPPRITYKFRIPVPQKFDKWQWEDYVENEVFETKRELLDSL